MEKFKYIKRRKESVGRRKKVSSVAIPEYQRELMNSENINRSELVTDLIERYLKEVYPDKLEKYKELFPL